MAQKKVLTLGVINLMPNKLETEAQWRNLIHAVDNQVDFQWIRMKSHQPKTTPLELIAHYYKPFEDVDLSAIDGVVITGAPVELLPFEEVTYWNELKEAVETLTEKQIPILAICWGAQALAYMRWHLEKINLDQKCFGIFEHETCEVFLSEKIGKTMMMPHSRHTGWSDESIQSIEALTPLIESKEAGVFLMKDTHGDFYVTGHMEYGKQTLEKEFTRDLLKGINIQPPVGTGCWNEAAQGIIDFWLGTLKKRRIVVGLLGFGTVNRGFYEGLERFNDRLAGSNDQVVVKKILVKDLNRLAEKPPSVRRLCVSRFEEILDDDEIEVVVEAINGAEPAGNYIYSALAKGKHVITANKAALAQNWLKLHEACKGTGAKLYYEASVCGGIPVIETLKTLTKVDEVLSIEGIVNGTTNYILSEMAASSISYAEALKSAQFQGYAEADPSADVDGIDAANKLAILCGICFNAADHPENLPRESIREKRSVSKGEKAIAFAYRSDGNNDVNAGVKVIKLTEDHPLYSVDGVENALIIKLRNLGTLFFKGPGAGSKPTGTAMLMDLAQLLKSI